MNGLIAQITSDAATLFYISLLVIFVAGLITTLVTKMSRDKVLKLFNGYHITIAGPKGRTDFGRLKVFSSGVELVYDSPYIDPRGRKKNSFMLYQTEIEPQVFAMFRYHDELTPDRQFRRRRQIRRSFNPSLFRRAWRWIRNIVNILRDAFAAALGAIIGQMQRTSPGALMSQGAQVTQVGQALLGKFGNAYEPLLEQYIGHPVILDLVDSTNPAIVHSFTGYLADYTQQFIAIFNAEHTTDQWLEMMLPEAAPTEAAPIPAAPAEPLKTEHGLTVRLEGPRFRLVNQRPDPIVVRRLVRAGFEPVELGAIIPPNATLTLPVRDASGAKLVMECIRCLDILAPRKYAIVRHAGEWIERRGLMDSVTAELQLMPQVPWKRTGQS